MIDYAVWKRGKSCILGGTDTIRGDSSLPPPLDKTKHSPPSPVHRHTNSICMCPQFLSSCSRPLLSNRLISPPPGLNIPHLWQSLSFISSFFNISLTHPLTRIKRVRLSNFKNENKIFFYNYYPFLHLQYF